MSTEQPAGPGLRTRAAGREPARPAEIRPVPPGGSGRARRAGRLAALDGLRVIAAGMVLVFHYVGTVKAQIGQHDRAEVAPWGEPARNLFPSWLHGAAQYGYTGVELFFLISGFVICMSGWGRRPAEFFVSRVSRLVPGYWAAIALTAGVLMVFPRLTKGISPSLVLANLTMTQTAYQQPNLDPAYWSIFVELIFYLLFGLVAWRGVTYRRMVGFCVLWSAGALVADGSHNQLLMLVLQPQYTPFFVGGIAYYLIYRFGSNLLLWAIVTYSWLLTMIKPHAYPLPQQAGLLTAYFAVMALVATHRLDWVRARWLVTAGAITYPLYLIHQDIGFTAIAYLHPYVPPLMLVAEITLAMVLAAWLIHALVERPLGPRLRIRLREAVREVIATGPPGRARQDRREG